MADTYAAGFEPITKGTTYAEGFEPVTPKASAKPQKYGPSPQADSENIVTGAIKDTLGVSGRPGSRSAADTILRPQDWTEVAAREAALAPLTALSMPIRIGAQGALGALERLTAGKSLDDAGWGAVIDVATAAFTEGALGAVGAGAKKLAKPLLESRAANETAQRAFKWASEAPQKALDAIAHRLPRARVIIPSIDPSKKITFQEAIEKLSEMEGAQWRQARAEIADWMKRLDKQVTPKPNAGAVFKDQVPRARFTPAPAEKGTLAQRGAAQLATVADSSITRGVADTAMTTPADDMTGLPIGGMPILKAIEGGKTAWHWLKDVLH